MSYDVNELFKGFRGGDRICFARMYEPLSAEMATSASAKGVRIKEDVEEIVVDAMLKLWKHREKMKSYDHARNFCYKMVANACTDYFRREARQRKRMGRYIKDFDRDDAIEFVMGASRWYEVMKLIEAEIPHLPPRQQQVFRLLCEHMPVRDIAQELGIEISVVYKQRDAAYGKLRLVLEKKGYDASTLILLCVWWNI